MRKDGEKKQSGIPFSLFSLLSLLFHPSSLSSLRFSFSPPLSSLTSDPDDVRCKSAFELERDDAGDDEGEREGGEEEGEEPLSAISFRTASIEP